MSEETKAAEKAEKPKAEKAEKVTGPKRYFIVNPGGGIQEVTLEHARELLRQPGWRMAKREEIDRYLAAPSHRGFGPIAARWAPEPEAVEIEE